MYTSHLITSPFQERLKHYSTYLAKVLIAFGILVLAGWQFNVEIIKRIIPGLVAMNPVTAVCFILNGIIIFFNTKTRSKKSTYLQRSVTILIFSIGLSCLLMNTLGIPNAIDQLLFTEKLADNVSNVHNRMAPNTAFNFILTGISLFLLTVKKEKYYKVSHYLVLITTLIALLSIIGYIYGVRSFYGFMTYIPMALHTSLCFLLTSSVILMSTSDKGIMAELTNNYLGSILVRKLIPAIIIVPVLLGCLTIYGENKKLYVPHFGTALFTTATC